MQVALAIGGNVGDRVAILREATRRITVGGVAVLAVSALYETPPWGYADQPPFLNGAVRGATALAPLDLLRLAKQIEGDLGRTPSFRNAPRPVDIDIALYGDQIVADEIHDLHIPHPRLPERGFALVPLMEIAPEWRHPALGRTVADLRAALGPTPEITRFAAAHEWYPRVTSNR